MIISGIAIPAIINYRSGAPPIPMPFEEPKLDQFYKDLNIQYHPTYNHLSTYFVGILVGFLLIENKNSLKIGIHWKLISWTVLPIATFLSVSATYLWTGLELEYSRITSAAYSGLHRFVYILFYAWIAIYCSTTNKSNSLLVLKNFSDKKNSIFSKGIVSRVLSSKFFIPLSRLSFSVYLIHILVVWYFVLQTRQLIRFSFVDFVSLKTQELKLKIFKKFSNVCLKKNYRFTQPVVLSYIQYSSHFFCIYYLNPFGVI
jgi:hypothetical protein